MGLPMADNNGWMYSDAVKDHFFHPRNLLEETPEDGEFDGYGEVGSPACGDVMRVWIKVDEGKIAECKWQTFGCASAIAATSMMSEMAIGKTMDEALELTPAMITEALGGLPNRKIHCSVLGDQALKKAIEDYRG